MVSEQGRCAMPMVTRSESTSSRQCRMSSLGELHGRVDAVLVHGAHLAVDHRAQAELVHGRAGGAGQRDVGHVVIAAGESIQTAQDGGVEPVGSFHAPAFLGHFRKPLHIGRIVDHAAQHRLLEAGVQINQAGHDGGQARSTTSSSG